MKKKSVKRGYNNLEKNYNSFAILAVVSIVVKASVSWLSIVVLNRFSFCHQVRAFAELYLLDKREPASG